MFSQRRRDERGAILPLTIVMLGVTLLLASLVVDIGGDRVVRRDVQAVADVLALDLARNLDGRPAGDYPGYSASRSKDLLEAEKKESIARQRGVLGGIDPDDVTAQLWMANPTTGMPLGAAASGQAPNAIKVWVTGRSGFRFLPTTPTFHPQRPAVAALGPPIVCISAGATLADLTPGGSLDLLLGRLIGIDRLSVVSPSGVAALDAQIPLGDLATHLGVGTVDQIATANVSGRAFLDAAADVLSNDGQIAGADLLHLIAAHVNGTTNIDVGSILAMATGTGSAANLKLDAFSLVQAVIEVSNKNNFVDVVLSTPGMSIQAKIIEAPRVACGPAGTRARSAQIQVQLVLNVPGVATIEHLALSTADGWGEIAEIACSPDIVDVTAETAAARLSLTIKPLLLPRVNLPGPGPDNFASIAQTASESQRFTYPDDGGLPASQTAGGGDFSLGLTRLTSNLALKAVLGLLEGPLDLVLGPVVESLGIRIGSVEIRPTSRPACNEPVLRG